MPRRSAAALAVTAAPDLVSGPAEPPADMPEAEAEKWRDLVKDLPSGHLRSADLVLLRSLCRNLVREDALWARHAEYEELATDEAARAEDRIFAVKAAPAVMEEILKLQRSSQTYASKLRLCASANTRIETGSNRRHLPPSGNKPWGPRPA